MKIPSLQFSFFEKQGLLTNAQFSRNGGVPEGPEAHRGVVECLQNGELRFTLKPVSSAATPPKHPKPQVTLDACGPQLNHTFHKLVPLQERPFPWSSFTRFLLILRGGPSCL